MGKPDPEDQLSPEELADASPPVTPDELSEFLGRKATLKRAMGIIRPKVKEQDVEDRVHTAAGEAMAASTMPRRASMQAWFDRICRRVVASNYRVAARRKKYQGPMPQAPVLRDEAGEPIDDLGDAIVDNDPSVDPSKEDPRLEGILFARFMRDATKDDALERETFAIMEEWTDDEDERSVAEIAKAHGLTEDAVYKRVERLRLKYEAPFRRWRNGMFLWLFLGTSVAIAIGVFLWRWLTPDIRPDPDFNPPRPPPSASASAAPPEPTFDQAQPPPPDGLKPGQKPPKP